METRRNKHPVSCPCKCRQSLIDNVFQLQLQFTYESDNEWVTMMVRVMEFMI
jgi:hypothetical protein